MSSVCRRFKVRHGSAAVQPTRASNASARPAWEADWASDGGRGTPGQGGGGGGGRRGGLGVCSVQGRRRGRLGRGRRLLWTRRQGGENGYPSIGLVALHARVTVRDSEIDTSDGGEGG